MSSLKKMSLIIFALTLALMLVANGSASAAEPIKIGVFGPMSGPVAHAGTDSKLAAQLLAKEVNAKGGINGRPIELYLYDDRLDNREAVAIANRLSRLDKVDAAICSSYSGPCIAAARVFDREKVPMIAAYAGSVKVVKGTKYIFRWANLADVMGYAIAYEGSRVMGLKRWAVLTVDNEFPLGGLRGFKEGLKKWGGELVYDKIIQFREQDFKPYLTAIKALNPEAIYLNGFGIQITGLRRQGADLGIFPKTKSFSMCVAIEQVIFKSVGEAGRGHIGLVPFSRSGRTPQMLELIEKWKKAYDTDIIGHEAGLTYDSLLLLLEGAQRGGGSREGIYKGLASITEHISVAGLPAKYSPIHEVIRPLFVAEYDPDNTIYRIIGEVGDPEILDPAPWYKYY